MTLAAEPLQSQPKQASWESLTPLHKIRDIVIILLVACFFALPFMTNATGEQADEMCYADRIYTNYKFACGEPILDDNGKPTGQTSGYNCPCKDTETAGTVNGHCTGALRCHGDTFNGKPLEPLSPILDRSAPPATNNNTPHGTPDEQVAQYQQTLGTPQGDSEKPPITAGRSISGSSDLIDAYTGALIGTVQETQTELPNLPMINDSNPQTFGAPPSGQIDGDTSPLSPASPESAQKLDLNENIDFTSGPGVGYGAFEPVAYPDTSAAPDDFPQKNNNVVQWSGAGIQAPSTFGGPDSSQPLSSPTFLSNVWSTMSDWWSYLKGLF
jgi:hypothetical protein